MRCIGIGRYLLVCIGILVKTHIGALLLIIPPPPPPPPPPQPAKLIYPFDPLPPTQTKSRKTLVTVSTVVDY